MLKHAPARGHARADRRQREPADPEAGHRVSVAADGGSGGHRPQGQAAAAAARRASTTSTSTSSRSGIRTTRRCCRSAIGASPTRSKRRSATAATGAPPWPRAGVDADFYIFRDRSDDAVLPWDIIDGGMKTSFFQSEFEKGSARRVDPAAEAAERKPQASCRSSISAIGAPRLEPSARADDVTARRTRRVVALSCSAIRLREISCRGSGSCARSLSADRAGAARSCGARR